MAYFRAEALWTYFTIPFLFTYPGFLTEEIELWQENGETWRRLKATFSEHIASNTKEQVSYFSPDGLLCRHDYTIYSLPLVELQIEPAQKKAHRPDML